MQEPVLESLIDDGMESIQKGVYPRKGSVECPSPAIVLSGGSSTDKEQTTRNMNAHANN